MAAELVMIHPSHHTSAKPARSERYRSPSVAAAIACIGQGDGTGAACNFTADGKTIVILDRPLQHILGWPRVTTARGMLPIAGCASGFMAHITPQSLRVVEAGWTGDWFQTKLLCLGHQRGMPIDVHATCNVTWKLAQGDEKIRRAAISFKTQRLSIALPSFRLH